MRRLSPELQAGGILAIVAGVVAAIVLSGAAAHDRDERAWEADALDRMEEAALDGAAEASDTRALAAAERQAEATEQLVCEQKRARGADPIELAGC